MEAKEKHALNRSSVVVANNILVGTAKEKFIDDLLKGHEVKERVKIFGKVVDTYGLDAIFSLFPGVGDVVAAVLAACYLLYEGRNAGLPSNEMAKIVKYQIADIAIGTVPVAGDVIDYFFKANKKAAKIFEQYFQNLQKSAMEKGVTMDDIAHVKQDQKEFMNAMDAYYKGTVKGA